MYQTTRIFVFDSLNLLRRTEQISHRIKQLQYNQVSLSFVYFCKMTLL